jgi:hypothetical protein
MSPTAQEAQARAQTYTPSHRTTIADTPTNRLFDAIIEAKALRNDAALCRFLDMQPPVLSKMRHGKLPISAATLIRIYEATDWPIPKIMGYLKVKSIRELKVEKAAA